MSTGDVYLCICMSDDVQMLYDITSWRRLTELLIFVARPMREPEVQGKLSTDSYAFLCIAKSGESIGLRGCFMTPIGELIRKEFLKQERSVAWFARKLACDRTNIYRIFEKRSIDTDQLMRISVILNHNFFTDLTRETEEKLSVKNEQQ